MLKDEKDVAIQVSIALETYINQALTLVLKLNPIEVLLPLTVPQKPGDSPVIERSDPRFKGTIDSWLSMYDDVLKRGRPVPADLIGRAATIAHELAENKDKE